jgi:hypothetical protein
MKHASRAHQFALALFTAALVSVPASAGVILQSFTGTHFNEDIVTFDPFDPSLGTLTAVRGWGTISLTLDPASVDCGTSISCQYDYNMISTWDVGSPLLFEVFQTDGFASLSGGPPIVRGTSTSFIHEAGFEDLSFYLQDPIRFQSRFAVTAPDGATPIDFPVLDVDFSVQYEFDTVPAPSSLAAVALGLLLLRRSRVVHHHA